jgi:hypothetical protein
MSIIDKIKKILVKILTKLKCKCKSSCFNVTNIDIEINTDDVEKIEIKI